MYNGGVETEGNILTNLLGITRLRNREGDLAMLKNDLPGDHPIIKRAEAAINSAKWSIAARVGFMVLAVGVGIGVASRI